MALELRQAADTSRTVLLYYWICTFFLSAPVVLSKTDTYKRVKVFLHGSWCALVMGTTVVSSYIEYIVFNNSLPDVQKFLYISEYSMNVVIVITAPITSYSKRRIFLGFKSQMESIDKELSRIVDNDLSYKPIVRFLYIYIALLAIFAGLSLPTVFFYQNQEILGFLRSSMVYIVPNLVNATQLGQYYGILIFIKLRMISIKGFIENMRFELKNSTQNLTSLRITFSKLEYLHFKVNHKASSLTGITLLASFFIVSIQIFVFYQDISETRIRNLDLTFFSLIWMFLHFGKVVCIYWYNTEISKVRSDLNIVLNQHNHNYPDDYSITRFILQMMLDRRPYSMGVIELNMQDIKLFVMNITIYVIFLIQYDLILKTFNTIKNDPINNIIG